MVRQAHLIYICRDGSDALTYHMVPFSVRQSLRGIGIKGFKLSFLVLTGSKHSIGGRQLSNKGLWDTPIHSLVAVDQTSQRSMWRVVDRWRSQL